MGPIKKAGQSGGGTSQPEALVEVATTTPHGSAGFSVYREIAQEIVSLAKTMPVDIGPVFKVTAPEVVSIQHKSFTGIGHVYEVTTPQGALLFKDLDTAAHAFLASVNDLAGSLFAPITAHNIAVLKLDVPPNVNRIGLATANNLHSLKKLIENPPILVSP